VHRVFSVLLASLAILAVSALGSLAQEVGPSLWAVTGVTPDDVLHMRDVPSADSRRIADIPANARGLKNLGCLRKQPSLEDWMRMTQSERQDAKILWCRVDYRGRQGWVAARYLKSDGAPPN
jgi:hypothetical protein